MGFLTLNEETNAGFLIIININFTAMLHILCTILALFNISYLLIGGVSLLTGGVIGYYLFNLILNKKKKSILEEAEKEGEVIKKDKILQAKEKFLQLKAEHEKIINERNAKMLQAETRIKQKEQIITQKLEEVQKQKKELDVIKENLSAQTDIIEKKKEELERLRKQQIEQLEIISGLTAEEAKNQLIESLKEEAKTQAMSYINEIMDEAQSCQNKCLFCFIDKTKFI